MNDKYLAIMVGLLGLLSIGYGIIDITTIPVVGIWSIIVGVIFIIISILFWYGKKNYRNFTVGIAIIVIVGWGLLWTVSSGLINLNNILVEQLQAYHDNISKRVEFYAIISLLVIMGSLSRTDQSAKL